MSQSTSTLTEDRRKLADLVTATVEQNVKVMEAEQKELHRRFPAMASQPNPVNVELEAIRDFTQSDEYRQAVEAYLAGRLEVNLLVRILALLSQVAPLEFLR